MDIWHYAVDSGHTRYWVSLDPTEDPCDCPSALYRPTLPCKHFIRVRQYLESCASS